LHRVGEARAVGANARRVAIALSRMIRERDGAYRMMRERQMTCTMVETVQSVFICVTSYDI
jgi:hypothetical protein